MSSSFSERLGYKKPKINLQFDEVDNPLKAGLWDILHHQFFNDIWGNYGVYSDAFKHTTIGLWHLYFKEPIDSLPVKPKGTLDIIRKHFFNSKFPETYDFLEFMASLEGAQTGDKFIHRCNQILEREKSAFRFVGKQLTQITSEAEIEEVEAAQDQNVSASVASHIDAALTLYANRENPDYRNVVKEAISAVEAAARYVTGKPSATLGDAVKALKSNALAHSAFTKGVNGFYGWTCDVSRHAKKEDAPEITEAEARFMLVTCSAIANFLLSIKAEE